MLEMREEVHQYLVPLEVFLKFLQEVAQMGERASMQVEVLPEHPGTVVL
jgi:hypothetical protein